MTVERNHAIAIAIAALCQRESNLIVPCTRDFSRALSRLQVIAANSDWFIARFSPVVIGHRNYFGIAWFLNSHFNENRSIRKMSR